MASHRLQTRRCGTYRIFFIIPYFKIEIQVKPPLIVDDSMKQRVKVISNAITKVCGTK